MEKVFNRCEIHYLKRIQACPGLYFAAGSWNIEGTIINGTGVGESKYEAAARCRAERAESLALYRSAGYLGISAMSDYSTYGSAAASSFSLALQRAENEALEHYAVYRWWFGHHPPALPTPGILQHVQRKHTDWRRSSHRKFQILELPTDMHRSVYVAWSVNFEGSEFLIGASCCANPRHAAEAALKELIQMECGLEIVHFRRSAGVRLCAEEISILSRAEGLNMAECKCLLRPASRQQNYSYRFDRTSTDHVDQFQKTGNLVLRQAELPEVDDHYKIAFVSLRSDPPTQGFIDNKLDSVRFPWQNWSPY
ncbi:MAG: YcaO-like family protein [Rhodobacteraceae bacterium]|nr:YcaO-like family protein [Paracoccaceae bacterium]